jgi:phosphoglucosamine mutase
MTQKLFGTDGVRGQANTYPMTAEVALRLGAAVGRYFRRDGQNGHRVVIGKDTRLSSYMFESALTAGLTSTGMNAILLGPVPTPGVAYLTRSMRADLGVMISASHNPHQDNGIKFFGPEGFKLSDAMEADIEELVHAGVQPAKPENIGRARRVDDGLYRYIDRVKGCFPRDLSLAGLRIVIDCANGAAYRAAPEVLWELGAEVIKIGVSPDGQNINHGCGSTAPEEAAAAVMQYRADIGICLDGDADRVLIIDENGNQADGDQVMALLATRWAQTGRLSGAGMVATVMSNLGLERCLDNAGIALERSAVGDRHVVEMMRAKGYNIGGEQSGHIVMTDHATTGDGLAAALQVLEVMVSTDRRASDVMSVFEPVPQRLENIRVSGAIDVMDMGSVKAAILAGERKLQGNGRLVIRKSGTEPLIRVMAESDDDQVMNQVVDEIIGTIRSVQS